ncbi:MAG TPA: HD domain-containing phosphohydrolase [Polyangia bacterium]|nr:HD domain-containing phosphohydrolase [Polyangia bacterium]
MALKLPGRLALLFLAAGLVPLAVTLLVLAPRGQDALRTSAKLLHQSQVESLRARLDSAFDDLTADVRLLAIPPRDGDPGAVAERRALLRFLLEKHQELTIVTLFDGAAPVAGGQAYDRAQVDAADLAEHQRRALELLEQPGAATPLRASNFYPSARRGEVLVTLVAPFSAAGPRGSLAVEVSLRRVEELIVQTRVGRRGSAFIVDGDGRLVAHRNLDRALQREDLSSVSVVAQLKDNIARAASNGHPLTVVTDFTDDGRDQVGAFAPLGRLRWGVVVAEPREDAYGLARATWAHAAGWTLLALALTILGAVFFARRITRPVARLVEGTRSIAEGRFGVAVPVGGTPEIAELARVFNEASLKLARYDGENKELLAAVERGYLETLRVLVGAIEAKDPYTAGHSQRTAELAVQIARSMGLDSMTCNEIEFGGLLHDIGKIGIAEQILRKPARLDDEEMAIMRGHPAIGDAIVRNVEFLERIRAMIRNHHERFDGSGYPDGLRGDAIPIGARIVAVADAFDAITSDRVYQPGQSAQAAMAILGGLTGKQLDAGVVAALGRALLAMGAIEAADLPKVSYPPPSDRGRRPTLDFPTTDSARADAEAGAADAQAKAK